MHRAENIHIGLKDDGTVIGVSDADALKIKDRLKNNILPSCMGFLLLVMKSEMERIF